MKILIISHNPLSTYQNMGKSILSLIGGFNKEELSQLYIYPSIPDVEQCNSYYRITDKEVMKFYLTLKVSGKNIVPNFNKHNVFENEKDERIYRNLKNKHPSRMLARDMMWKFAHWFNKSLKNWIEEQNPTHLFVAPGTAKFLYDIALKISKKYNIPIITYICDDYYFVKKANGFLKRIQQNLLQKKIRKLMKHTSHIVTICKELEELYSKEFCVNATTIMTGSNYEISDKVKVSKQPKTITYMGNIRCNRFMSLAEIGRTIDEINKESGSNYSLEIYSAEKNKEILQHFDNIESVVFRGYVGGADFDEIFHSAEILLHTEAFDDNSIDLVKHSVSTKIADSLGSGIPLFAYGPSGVSSMKHLISNDCAVISTNKSELKETLERLFADTELLKKKAQNAIDAANKFHNSKKAGDSFRFVINNI